MKRNSLIDLFRFIAILIIMDHHIGMAGCESHFTGGFLVVEFFFFLTGFLTCRHFDKLTDNAVVTVSTKSYRALSYTARKFKPYFPLVFIMVAAQYLMTYFACYQTIPAFNELLAFINDLPNEMFLLKTAYGSTLIGPMWFLSAMFIVFPVFCLVLQLLDKNTFMILAFLSSLLYFGQNGFGDYFYFPMCLPRAFFDLLIGAIIYYAGTMAINKFYDKINSYVLAFVEVVFMVFIVLLLLRDWEVATFLLIWCMAIAVSLGMSEACGIISAKWMNFLGKLSFPMFLIHWFYVTLLGIFFVDLPEDAKMIVYYAATILTSAVYLLLSKRFAKSAQ